jgi:hypothetical protein
MPPATNGVASTHFAIKMLPLQGWSFEFKAEAKRRACLLA